MLGFGRPYVLLGCSLLALRWCLTPICNTQPMFLLDSSIKMGMVMWMMSSSGEDQTTPGDGSWLESSAKQRRNTPRESRASSFTSWGLMKQRVIVPMHGVSLLKKFSSSWPDLAGLRLILISFESPISVASTDSRWHCYSVLTLAGNTPIIFAPMVSADFQAFLLLYLCKGNAVAQVVM